MNCYSGGYMIEVYRLDDLLKKYGIDANKVLGKNDAILECEEYQDIDKTLDYLINELGISSRNIEKCPSIMYYAIDNVKENYEFLVKVNVNINNVMSTLHILNTNPKVLKETYYYIRDNYGIEYINKTASILKIRVSKIKEVEKIFSDKAIIIAAAYSKNSIEQLYEIVKICRKYNIKITSSVFIISATELEKVAKVCRENNIPIKGCIFHRTAKDIRKIIKICKDNNIEITGNLFNKNAKEVQKIVDICKKYRVPITSSIFLKTAKEVERIIIVCRENNISVIGAIFKRSASEIEKIAKLCEEYDIPIINSMFFKSAEEVEKIIIICKKNNISVVGGIFLKNAHELEESINYVRNTYGEAYLQPLIVNKNVEYLKVVLPYLDSLNVLSVVIKSASILTLTLDEIIERKEYIESIGEELVLSNGRFNSIFGLSKVNYRKLVSKKEKCLRLCRK